MSVPPQIFTLSSLLDLATSHQLTINKLKEVTAWWLIPYPFLNQLPRPTLSTHLFSSLLEQAQQLALSDITSLELAQQLLARWLVHPLESYLARLSFQRQAYLRQALYLYVQQALQAQKARFPRPQDAPQPLWDETCQAMTAIAFDLAWKLKAQQQALITLSQKPHAWPLMSEPSLTWKIKAHMIRAYHGIEPSSFSHLPLHLHGQMLLDDSAMAQTIESLQPLIDLKVTKSKLIGPLSVAAINHALPPLRHLSLDYCANLPLANLELPRAQHLRSLSLKKAKLHEELNHLHTLPRLHTLDLAESDLLSEQIIKMTPCRQIKRLSLDSCKDLSSLGLEMLAMALPSLRNLDVSRCPGMHAKVALELPPLQHLKASWCDGIDDGLIDYLIDRHPLHSLTLAHCRYLTDLGAEAIGELTKLKHLDLSHCLGITHDGLESCLSCLPSLESLHLTGQPLYEQGQWFKHLQQLTALSIPLHTTPEALLQLCPGRLQHLHMGPCRSWSAEEFVQLFTSPVFSKLETLIIEEARGVNDRVLAALSQIPTLKHLSLAGTPDKPQLFNANFNRLGEMPNLERLELSYGGKCDREAFKQVLMNAPRLNTLELGPMYKLTSEDITALRQAAPWIHLTCFGYEGLEAF